MQTIAAILTSLVFLLHVYIVLLETVMFRTRGVKIFRVPAEQVERMAPVMSNQGCYNLFLVVALTLGLFYPEPEIAQAFQVYGLACVIVAGLWGAVTVMMRILYVQTVPAALALVAVQGAIIIIAMLMQKGLQRENRAG
jgi:putative membrane protein